MRDSVEYLRNRITNGTSLSSIIDIFEGICQIPIDEDMILFETGTYDFTGKSQFYFSLVRQFPHEDDENDEYYQIHVDVLYTPTPKNEKFQEATWDIDIEGNIFEYIRASEAFAEMKNDKYDNIEIYMCET